MADDIPPPPDGYFDSPAEARRYYQLNPPGDAAAPAPAVPPPAPTPSNVPATPPGYYDTPSAARAGAPAPPTTYRGGVLPFSQDASGKTHLDWGAGVTGWPWDIAKGSYETLKPAVMTPGQIVTGETPTPYSPGPGTTAPDPAVMQHAADIAMTFSPTSAAARAGGVVPGMSWSYGTPTAQKLQRAADGGYAEVRASGLDFSTAATDRLTRNITDAYADKGIVSANSPQVHNIINGQLNSSPTGIPGLAPPPIGISGIQSARAALGRIEGSTTNSEERLAASIAKNKIDDFLMNATPSDLAGGGTFTGDPSTVAQTLKEAGQNYATAQRANDISGALDRAVTGISEKADLQAASSAAGSVDTAIRQKVRTFLQSEDNVRGLTDQQVGMLRGIVEGGPIRDKLRWVGDLLSGGATHGLAGAGLGGMAGMAGGGGLTEILAGGLGLPLLGRGMTNLADTMSQSALNRVETLIRQGAPLNQELASRRLQTIEPNTNINNALYRGALPQAQGGGGLLGVFTDTSSPYTTGNLFKWMRPGYDYVHGLLYGAPQLALPPSGQRPLTERDLAGRA